MTIASNVLLSSSGSKTVMAAELNKALRRVSPASVLLVADTDNLAPTRFLGFGIAELSASTASNPHGMAEELCELGVRAVFPSRDGELVPWASMRPTLEKFGISVVGSTATALQNVADKLRFAKWAKLRGFPAIETSDAPSSIDASRFVVKERFGSGSRGTLVDVDKKSALLGASLLKSPIFQQFVAGQEISIDAFLDGSSAVHGLVLRTRDRIRGGESEVTTTFRDTAIEALGQKVLEASGLRGPVVMQAIIADDGPRIVEINARFGGASSTSIAVGLNSLDWALWEVFRPEEPLPEFQRADFEVRNIRISNDLVVRW